MSGMIAKQKRTFAYLAQMMKMSKVSSSRINAKLLELQKRHEKLGDYDPVSKNEYEEGAAMLIRVQRREVRERKKRHEERRAKLEERRRQRRVLHVANVAYAASRAANRAKLVARTRANNSWLAYKKLHEHSIRQKLLRGGSEDICPICRTACTHRLSTCGHIMHRHCIAIWIGQEIAKGGNPQCPMCRQTLCESDLVDEFAVVAVNQTLQS